MTPVLALGELDTHAHARARGLLVPSADPGARGRARCQARFTAARAQSVHCSAPRHRDCRARPQAVQSCLRARTPGPTPSRCSMYSAPACAPCTPCLPVCSMYSACVLPVLCCRTRRQYLTWTFTQVLGKLGFSEADIAKLAADGAIELPEVVSKL